MITKAQKAALYDVWLRGTPSEMTPEYRSNGYGLQTYLTFRRQQVSQGLGCLMVKWQGMWLGIEPDGYTHS